MYTYISNTDVYILTLLENCVYLKNKNAYQITKRLFFTINNDKRIIYSQKMHYDNRIIYIVSKMLKSVFCCCCYCCLFGF